MSAPVCKSKKIWMQILMPGGQGATAAMARVAGCVLPKAGLAKADDAKTRDHIFGVGGGVAAGSPPLQPLAPPSHPPSPNE